MTITHEYASEEVERSTPGTNGREKTIFYRWCCSCGHTTKRRSDPVAAVALRDAHAVPGQMSLC